MRIALAQLNVTVGDLDGNRRLMEEALDSAGGAGADLVAFPELAVTGYPPEDLLLQPEFVRDNLASLRMLARACTGIAAVVGFVDEHEGVLYNAAALISDEEILGIYRKHHLPNYGVFDEARYFRPGDKVLVRELAGERIGVTICEDLWSDDGPQLLSARAGASIVVNINASPYHQGKRVQRQGLVQRRAVESGVPLVYVNMVGGQDELVFDGHSVVFSGEGAMLARASQFRQELLLAEVPGPPGSRPAEHGRTETLSVSRSLEQVRGIAPDLDEEGEVYEALVLSLHDYLAKNGFGQVLIGISGGIDSALTACLAVDALGAENVLGVSNPGDYTSTRSVLDAELLAENLKMELIVIPIKEINQVMLESLEKVFAGTEPGIAEENIQARIRGLLWMAISNKTRRVVLATGNKSELSVGYATLYGDMVGGYAVLKDVPKTLVYRLARWRNRQGSVIPESILERPPTAELKADQLDTDSLPPYEVLDPILEAYVEQDMPVAGIVARGFDEATVSKVVVMVDRAEYKRRQAPPGTKITPRAFGKDRRVPITNRYRRTSPFSPPC